MAITSDEVNYLVYRYLQESGFTHSAFVFGYESFAHKSPINVNEVPPGALISFVQKGLQYLELEANLNNEGTAVDGDFAALSAREMLTKDTDELKRTVADRRERASERDRAMRDEGAANAADRSAHAGIGNAAGNGGGGAAPGVAAARDGDGMPQEIPSSQVTTLVGHDSEVFICAWSPAASLLASGSGDSTARIWDLNARGEDGQPRAKVLKHFNRANEKAKDVTTLDWNGDGTLLATGSYDGLARIWSRDGELRNTLSAHKGPIFSLKWNRKGTLLLSGSVDKTAIIWDGRTGEVKQQFEFHTAPTLDVDWRDNSSFATCSTDKLIYVCRLGLAEPQKALQGHSDEVNAIKWDPQGKLLASCSDDHTAKIWAVDREQPLVHDLTAHTKEIYTIKWSPTGPGTANPTQRLMLVSASFDTSIRLWDAETGQCIFALTQHTQPVYSVAFSPNGQLLASGSFDKSLHVWSVRDGSLVRTYMGKGGIFEVCWARDGEHVAACFSNKVVAVLKI